MLRVIIQSFYSLLGAGKADVTDGMTGYRVSVDSTRPGFIIPPSTPPALRV